MDEPTARFTLIPESFFSWRFRIEAERETLTNLNVTLWERCAFALDEDDYVMRSVGGLRGRFQLRRGDEILAAAKVSTMRRRFLVDHAGVEYELRARGVMQRTFLLRRGEVVIGNVTPSSPFGRRAVAELPAVLPLPVRLFISWLVIVMWKREVVVAT